jgi:hypothetical protein
MQVTAKLAALYCKAVKLPFLQFALSSATFHHAIETWLTTADAAASPASRAAAAVRQQLQQAKLLQHLAAGMNAAAARLTAIAATAASSSGSSGSSSSSATPQPTTERDPEPLEQLRLLDGCCAILLKSYRTVTCALSPSAGVMQAALPAAPAALRLSLAIFQTYSRLQKLWKQQYRQLQQVMQLQSFMPRSSASDALQAVPEVLLLLAVALGGAEPAKQQPCSAARELMQYPELLSCLAIMLVVTVLGLDTGSGDGAAAAAATSSSGSAIRVPGSNTAASGQQQQQQAQQADSSSSTGGSCSSTGLRLACLTPLSSSLFDILGVSKGTMLQAARELTPKGVTTLTDVAALLSEYNTVFRYQVSKIILLLYTYFCAAVQHVVVTL